LQQLKGREARRGLAAVTKKVDTWMPLLVDKYLGDTTHLTTEQHGAYLLLLMSMWKKDGRLPANDVGLAQIAKLSPAKWRAMRPILIDGLLLREEDGLIVQKRLAAELARSKASTEKKSGAGSAGAAKRWGKDGGGNGNPDGGANGGGNGNAIANASQTGWVTGASTPPPDATHLPDDASAPSSRAAPTADEPEPAVIGTAAGAICLAMRRAGYPATSPNDRVFRTLVSQGATAEEFVEAAQAAMRTSPAKGWGWVLTRVQNRRNEAAAITLAPKPVDPQAWRKTDLGIRAMAEQLGVQSRPTDTFEAWDRRVFTAWQRAGEPQPRANGAAA
jgi:uncharacterized protein YdaU (DUF1376 family)